MTTKLNVLLFLTFVITIVVTALAMQPTGSEGPVGVWLLLLFPCLFATVLVFAMVAKGSLDFIPGGLPIQLAIAVGAIITFCTGIFATIAQGDSVVYGLLIAVSFLILAACTTIINHSFLPNPRLGQWVAAIFLGGTALAGWGLAGTGIFLSLQSALDESALQAQQAKEQEEQYEQRDIADYAELDDSPPLKALLRFTWSRNDQVRRQARIQASSFPDLDNELIALLDRDCEEAISYIAKVYEHPPATLAPSWGKMLERKLKSWDTLQYDEHAGTWEYNLREYFVGAQKIQNAGGSLRPELLAWHKHLQKCKGLENLAAFVEKLL